MSQPPGFVDSDHPDYVCHLNRTIYGVKQASKAWFDHFTLHLLNRGSPVVEPTPHYLFFIAL